MRRWLLLWPLLATACATDRDREVEAMAAALASARASLEAVRPGAPQGQRPAPARPQPPASRQASLPRPEATPRPEAAPPPGGAPPRAASSLMGAAPEALVAALGEPALRREEGGASVWLYSAAGCHLDIVLYPTPAGLRVAHVQARAGGVAQSSEATCLREIAERPRRAPRAGPPELHSQAEAEA